MEAWRGSREPVSVRGGRKRDCQCGGVERKREACECERRKETPVQCEGWRGNESVTRRLEEEEASTNKGCQAATFRFRSN